MLEHFYTTFFMSRNIRVYCVFQSETVFTAHSHFCQARFQFPFCFNRDALNLLCSFRLHFALLPENIKERKKC